MLNDKMLRAGALTYAGVVGAFLLLSATNDLMAQPLLSALQQEIADVVKQAKPAVVTVFNTTKGAGKSGSLFDLFRDRQHDESKVKVGTGLIISSDGFILTKESVVGGAERIDISLDDGSIYPASWVMRDSARGIAVLKILAENLPYATIATPDDISAGSWITVIGNSLGVPHAVSVGVISAVQPDGMMQISANVDPGSNGSPVFNVNAEALGIVAGRISVVEKENEHEHYFGSTALVFSLTELMPFIQAATQQYYSQFGWIGVRVMPDSTSGGHPRILNLHEHGPGEEAGLQVGDIIIYYNGQPVISANRLRELVMRTQPGQEVTVKILRAGEETSVRVRVREKAPQALRELAVNHEQRLAPVETSPPAQPRNEPGVNSLLLQRRLDALEKEVRSLRNYYLQNSFNNKKN